MKGKWSLPLDSVEKFIFFDFHFLIEVTLLTVIGWVVEEGLPERERGEITVYNSVWNWIWAVCDFFLYKTIRFKKIVQFFIFVYYKN